MDNKKNNNRIENKQRNKNLDLERVTFDFTPESYPDAEVAEEFIVETENKPNQASKKSKMNYLYQKSKDLE